MERRGEILRSDPTLRPFHARHIDNIRLSGYKHAMKDTAQLFKALSDETRLRIIALLTHGELCVCDLMEVMGLPQSTVSRHLATLRQAGLVEDRRQGVWIYYRLFHGDGAFFDDLCELLQRHLAEAPQTVRDREALAAFRAGSIPVRCT